MWPRYTIWLQRVVEKPQIKMESKQGAKDPEYIALTLWWTTDQRPLQNFMATAMKTMMEEESDDRLDIYVRGLGYCWAQIGCN